MTISNAQLAQQVSDLINRWDTRETEMQAWMGGTPTGGPSSDGYYPLTDAYGVTRLTMSPALLEDEVSGTIGTGAAYAAAAEASSVASSAAKVLSETARDSSMSYRDAAQGARDLALTYRDGAANSAANALANRNAADASAETASADAAAAAASAVAAAASQAGIGAAEINAAASASAASASAAAAAVDAAAAAAAVVNYYTKTAADAKYAILASANTFAAVNTFTTARTATTAPIALASTAPGFQLRQTDAAADNRVWQNYATSEALLFDAATDAGVGTTWMRVERTAGTIDSIGLTASNVTTSAALNVSGMIRATGGYTTGAGMACEIGISGTNTVFQAYDRTAAAYSPLLISASSLSLRQGATTRINVASTGVVSFPNTANGSFVVGTSFLANRIANIDGGNSDALALRTTTTPGNIPLTCWNATDTSDAVFARFSTESSSATTRGSITYNRTSSVVAYNTTSDRRLKTNITDALDAGSIIDSIQVRAYDWKETGFHTPFGFVAQELNAVAPIAVTAGDGGEEIESVWGVDPGKLVPLLIKELQSLRARVATIEQLP